MGNKRRTLTFSAAILVTGFTGMIAQVLIMRELLVTFLGNELSIGVLLGNWLVLEAAGAFLLGRIIESRRNKILFFVWALLLFTLGFPASLFLSRTVTVIVGALPGQGFGVLTMLYCSAIVLLPTSFIHGALFAFGCRIRAEQTEAPGLSAGRSVGQVYILETIGTAVGGVVFTYLLLPFFHAFHIVVLIAIVNLLVCVMLLKPALSKTFFLHATPVAVVLAGYILAFFGGAEFVQKQSISKRWRGMDVVYYENSRYGNVSIIAQKEQRVLYYDGVPSITLPVPDIAFVQDLAHFPLLHHRRPQSVLLVSGGAGGLITEIKKHEVLEIDYVELDPMILEALEVAGAEGIEEVWNSFPVTVFNTDGRRFIERREARYDIVLLVLDNPTDLQINRFYTTEFFERAKTRLAPDGILALSLPGSYTYLGPELKDLNACIDRTLRASFDSVVVIPGDHNIFLCSKADGLIGVTPGKLSERLRERGVRAELFTDGYLAYRLRKDRQDWFNAQMRSSPALINRDFHPLAVFYSLGLWNAMFSPRIQSLYRHVVSFAPANMLLILLAIPVLVVVIVSGVAAFSRDRSARLAKLRGFSNAYCVVSTGCASLLFDLFVVFLFQIVLGYLFHMIGLLMALFMFGSGAGAFLMDKRIKKRRLHGVHLAAVDGLIAVFSLALVALMIGLRHGSGTAVREAVAEPVFFSVGFLAGLLTGSQFPLAAELTLRNKPNISAQAGTLSALDLIGGWIGGIIGGALLLPVLGLINSCLFVFLLKLTSCGTAFFAYLPGGIKKRPT